MYANDSDVFLHTPSVLPRHSRRSAVKNLSNTILFGDFLLARAIFVTDLSLKMDTACYEKWRHVKLLCVGVYVSKLRPGKEQVACTRWLYQGTPVNTSYSKWLHLKVRVYVRLTTGTAITCRAISIKFTRDRCKIPPIFRHLIIVHKFRFPLSAGKW